MNDSASPTIGIASCLSLYPLSGSAGPAIFPDIAVHPLVPSRSTVPSVSTTVQLAAIKEGAAELYAQIFHSTEVCDPSGSPSTPTAFDFGTVVLQLKNKAETNTIIIFFIF